MGLDIYVGEKKYYSHSYAAIHELRSFAKGIDGDRFQAFINHPDNEGGYLPRGVQPPTGSDPSEEYNGFTWQSSERLYIELASLAGQIYKMDDDLKGLLKDLLNATLASLEERRPMEFR